MKTIIAAVFGMAALGAFATTTISCDADRLPHFAYQWELVNPHPEKEVAEIRIAIPDNKWDFTHRLLALTLRAVRKN